ncbi:MAG: hypothetical protein LAT68_15060 [Cyclobacteriaceae bacterium]|nr:hypothetical protein [Cyclobacteriaceae bacterium]MCH8517640.1 hypothetical protein [Cyclobacteriaceae bacterium]
MKQLLTLLFTITFVSAYSQSYEDQVLLFGMQGPVGSARVQGLGGAATALGGDISSTFYNSAGLGMYRSSELVITPAMNFGSADTEFLGNTRRQNTNNFHVNNLGIVFSGAKDPLEDGIWRGGSFAITYQRTNTFNNDILFSGQNTRNSMIDFFVADLSPDLTDLAFDAFLVDIDANDRIDPVVSPPGEDFPVTQTGRVNQSRLQSQWNFSYGGNVDDKFFFGFGLGIVSFDYRSEFLYSEEFLSTNAIATDDGLLAFANWNFDETVRLQGSGINANFGIIYKPTAPLNLGLSITTPTYIDIQEESTFGIVADYNGFQYDENRVLDRVSVGLPTSRFEQALITPTRISAGASYFFSNKGFISFDVESINYGNSRFRDLEFGSGNFFDDDINPNIRRIYGSTFNYRLGGEARLGLFRLRAGGNYMGDPFEVNDGIDRSRLSLSAGAGVRLRDYYFDFAIVNTRFNSDIFNPYDLPADSPFGPAPRAVTNNQFTNVMLTIGFNL